jgi:type II secretion system protein H
MSARTPTSSRRAFTLVELVLVLVVMATALAIAAPSLGGWRRGQRLRDAGEEFLATARHARALAIANSQLHRLYVNTSTRTYWIEAQDGQQFVRLGTSLGREFSLPAGYTVSLVSTPTDPATGQSLPGSPLEFIEFYPSGRMHPLARVEITADDGGQFLLESPTAAEGLTVPSRPGVTR